MKCMVRKCMTRKGLLASTGWTHELLWRFLEASLLITARKRSLGQGNIFRSVCQEFCPRGCVVPGGCLVRWGGPGGGVCVWSRGCGPGGMPGGDPPGTATAAGGTHPTGMHSYYQIFSCYLFFVRLTE